MLNKILNKLKKEKPADAEFNPVEKVPCEKHGETAAIILSIDNKPISTLCFRCYSEFLNASLKDYTKV